MKYFKYTAFFLWNFFILGLLYLTIFHSYFWARNLFIGISVLHLLAGLGFATNDIIIKAAIQRRGKVYCYISSFFDIIILGTCAAMGWVWLSIFWFIYIACSVNYTSKVFNGTS